MSEEATSQASPVPATPEAVPASAEIDLKGKNATDESDSKSVDDAPEPTKEVATEVPAPIETSDQNNTNGKETTSSDVTEDKTATEQQETDTIMKESSADAPSGEPADATADTPAGSKSITKLPRRKSGGVPEHKTKKLNKKASKAKMTHTDAQPGDHFFIRLKGYPLWPGIVAEPSMRPDNLRQLVTAAKDDGTYNPGYEDGGAKVNDRSFLVMYLQTNEFGFIPNFDLVDIDPDAKPSNKSKDLAAAFQLLSERHDLEFYKDILRSHAEEVENRRLALEAKEEEKLKSKDAEQEKKKLKETKAKKSADKKSKPIIKDQDEDIEMADGATEVESDDADAAPKPSKGKKRKADQVDTPAGTESEKKKVRVKLNNTSKTNGTSTPKAVKDSATKTPKSKSAKKSSTKVAATPEVVAPLEPPMSAEDLRSKKEKEILFLRHKLQKGMLNRDQKPKAEEMKQMAEFITKLEGYTNLEVSIIRATKINKVLKAILKLESIPRDGDFKFRSRSQDLLDQWNRLLATEQGTPVALATTNGVNGEDKATDKVEAENPKTSSSEPANGSKESSGESKVEKADENDSSEKSPATESKEQGLDEKSEKEPTDEAIKEPAVEPEAVESTS